MSRAALVLVSDAIRDRAVKWVRGVPPGTRIEFKAPRRTLDQNAMLWACLTDVADQARHMGRAYPSETWKALFMHALGREVQFLPTLDGQSVFPLGFKSSDLSKAEMSDLIEFILAWGAENGVTFHLKEHRNDDGR